MTEGLLVWLCLMKNKHLLILIIEICSGRWIGYLLHTVSHRGSGHLHWTSWHKVQLSIPYLFKIKTFSLRSCTYFHTFSQLVVRQRGRKRTMVGWFFLNFNFLVEVKEIDMQTNVILYSPSLPYLHICNMNISYTSKIFISLLLGEPHQFECEYKT